MEIGKWYYTGNSAGVLFFKLSKILQENVYTQFWINERGDVRTSPVPCQILSGCYDSSISEILDYYLEGKFPTIEVWG